MGELVRIACELTRHPTHDNRHGARVGCDHGGIHACVSGSNWVSNYETGVILTVVGFVLVGILADIGSHSGHQDKGTDHQNASQSSGDMVLTANKHTGSSNYQPSCDNPKTKDEYDVCQQKRIAVAAEDTSHYDELQFWWVGIGGLALLGLTLAAATAAAIYTKKTADIAGDTARKQLRAYPVVNGGDVTVEENPDNTIYLRANVELVNSGQTPANNLSMTLQTKIVEDGKLPVFDCQAEERQLSSRMIAGPSVPIGETNRIPITHQQLEMLQNGRSKLYAWGKFTYRDIYDDNWCSEFRCVAWDYTYSKNRPMRWTWRTIGDGTWVSRMGQDTE